MKKLSDVINKCNKETKVIVNSKPDDDKIYINDLEVINAINNYLKGKQLERESKNLIDSAKEVFERKILKLGINTAFSDKYEVNITSYTMKRFDTNKFKDDNPSVYNEYISSISSKRFNIKERVI